MVSARAVQAIAVAASTSGTHAAFVAAATVVKSCALLLVEIRRHKNPNRKLRELTKLSIDAAVDAAMATSGCDDNTATNPSAIPRPNRPRSAADPAVMFTAAQASLTLEQLEAQTMSGEACSATQLALSNN
jgi:hypothetical protein